MKARNLNYGNCFESEFRSHYEITQFNGQFDEYLRTCVNFVTITFDQKRISRSRKENPSSNCDFEMNAFANLFYLVVKEVDRILGLKPPRPRPFVLYCIDYEGSRYTQFGPARTKNLHIHSLWSIPPSEVEIYRKVLSSFRIKMPAVRLLIDGIDVRSFDLKHNLADAISYTMKAWTKATYGPTSWVNFGVIRGHEPLFKMPKFPRQESRLAVMRRTAAERLSWEPWEV